MKDKIKDEAKAKAGRSMNIHHWSLHARWFVHQLLIMPLCDRLIQSLCALSVGFCCAIRCSASASPFFISPSPFVGTTTTTTTAILKTYSLSIPTISYHNPSLFRESSSWQIFGRKGGDAGTKEKKPNKSNLPEKICIVCGRPFTWRKKWERCWDEVTCCSKSCNSQRRSGK